jgi:two-component system sensor histidine kinase RegB
VIASAVRPVVAAQLAQPGVRVRTLVRLRWTAILGQLVTLALIARVFDYPLPLASALAAVGAAALLNVGLVALYPRNARLIGGEALLHLGFDLVQLGVLLFLTGGLVNPFCVLLIVPVTISATLLSARATAALLLTALGILFALWNWALPLPWAGHPIFLPPLYRGGILLGLLLAMIFLSIYAWQVSAEGRRRQLALIAMQSALERESKMSALGSLAAAAAHELGGPLGTITLIARDLEIALANDPQHGADVTLLVAEAKRSRDILVGIANRAEAEDPFPRVALPALLIEAAGEGVTVDVTSSLRDSCVARTPELLHGLHNLIANARRHAANVVALTASAIGDAVEITVTDDGPGFPDHLLPHLGEPFLGPSRSGAGGTGLGIFIATTLLERTGGKLAFANLPQGGAKVAIRWPRHHLFQDSTEELPWPPLSPPRPN